jgi:hypothetical protein
VDDPVLLPTGYDRTAGAAASWRTPVLVGGAGLAWIATAAIAYRPEGTSLPVACPFHALTGLDCPGCGSTRSLGALARLDPITAMDHNLLVPVALVLLTVAWVRWLRARRSGVPAPELVRGPAAIVALAAVVVAFAVVRNLEAASWLASGLAGAGP